MNEEDSLEYNTHIYVLLNKLVLSQLNMFKLKFKGAWFKHIFGFAIDDGTRKIFRDFYLV